MGREQVTSTRIYVHSTCKQNIDSCTLSIQIHPPINMARTRLTGRMPRHGTPYGDRWRWVMHLDDRYHVHRQLDRTDIIDLI